jgi:hypothetical protein
MALSPFGLNCLDLASNQVLLLTANLSLMQASNAFLEATLGNGVSQACA